MSISTSVILTSKVAALVERFVTDITEGRHSVGENYRRSKAKDELLNPDLIVLPHVLLSIQFLTDSTDFQNRELKDAWILFLKDFASYIHAETPPERFGFKVWVDWVRGQIRGGS